MTIRINPVARSTNLSISRRLFFGLPFRAATGLEKWRYLAATDARDAPCSVINRNIDEYEPEEEDNEHYFEIVYETASK